MTPQQIIQEAFFAKDVKEAAKVLERFSVDDIVTTVQQTSATHIANLGTHLSPCIAADVLRALPSPLKANSLRRMPPTALARVLRHCSLQEQEDVLKSLDPWMLEDVKELLHYPIGSAGGLMTTKNHVLCDDLTVEEALSQLRTAPANGSSELFLISRGGQFTGTLTYHDLLKAERETRLSVLGTPCTVTVEPTETERTVMQILQRGRCQTLPVVDKRGCLLGTIESEAIEKSWKAAIIGLFQTIIGVPNTEPTNPSTWIAVQKRVWWIGANFFIALLAVSGLALIDPTLVTSKTAALFLPLLLILPTSVASQTYGVVWRGMVLGAWSMPDRPKVALRELRIAFILGGIVGLAGISAATIWSPALHVSIALGVALWIATTLAGSCGTILSLGLEQTAKTQIQLSALLLIFLTQVFGISCYFGMIYLFRSGTLTIPS